MNLRGGVAAAFRPDEEGDRMAEVTVKTLQGPRGGP